MARKTVVHRQKAEDDIDSALTYYLAEAGTDVAFEFVAHLENLIDLISKHPAIGSAGYSHSLQIEGSRHLPIKKFPYVVFYVEYERHIEVIRILHQKTGIPSWLGDDG
jgi:toxin ParE1/3/4